MSQSSPYRNTCTRTILLSLIAGLAVGGGLVWLLPVAPRERLPWTYFVPARWSPDGRFLLLHSTDLFTFQGPDVTNEYQYPYVTDLVTGEGYLAFSDVFGSSALSADKFKNTYYTFAPDSRLAFVYQAKVAFRNVRLRVLGAGS